MRKESYLDFLRILPIMRRFQPSAVSNFWNIVFFAFGFTAGFLAVEAFRVVDLEEAFFVDRAIIMNSL
ncbi:MAG: hypothetical protein V4494_01930 [Chlamydiota bacterium]